MRDKAIVTLVVSRVGIRAGRYQNRNLTYRNPFKIWNWSRYYAAKARKMAADVLQGFSIGLEQNVKYLRGRMYFCRGLPTFWLNFLKKCFIAPCGLTPHAWTFPVTSDAIAEFRSDRYNTGALVRKSSKSSYAYIRAMPLQKIIGTCYHACLSHMYHIDIQTFFGVPYF